MEDFSDSDTVVVVSVRCQRCGETRPESISREHLAIHYEMHSDGIYVSKIDPTYECPQCWLPPERETEERDARGVD